MSWIDSMLARAGLVKTGKIPGVKEKGVSLDDLFGSRPGQYFSTLAEQKQQLGAYVDWVYGAARAIAEDVATIDFKLYVNRTTTKNVQLGQRLALYPKAVMPLQRKSVIISTKDYMGRTVKRSAPAVEEIDSHPLLDMLNHPNPFMTKDEFFELTVLHMELAGEAFWTVIRNKMGVPVELWPLMPYLVKVLPDSKRFISGYTYLVPNGGELPLDPDDVIHFKYSNPLNLYRGMSVVAAAARAIDTDAHAADYNRKFFYNGAIPDATLETEANLTDDQFKRLKDEWNSSYGGTSNSHKVALLEAGLKFNITATTQKDMDFLNSRNFNRDQILALFRVSKSILGLIEDSNRANMEAADYNHAKRVTRPKMLRIANRITEDLAPQFDVKLIVGFTDPVPEDKEFALKAKQASLNNWVTIDEVREDEGKEPLEGGLGSQLYVSNMLLPIGHVAAQPLPGEGMDDLEDMDRPEDLDDDTDDSKSRSFTPKKKASTQVKTTANE